MKVLSKKTAHTWVDMCWLDTWSHLVVPPLTLLVLQQAGKITGYTPFSYWMSDDNVDKPDYSCACTMCGCLNVLSGLHPNHAAMML